MSKLKREEGVAGSIRNGLEEYRKYDSMGNVAENRRRESAQGKTPPLSKIDSSLYTPSQSEPALREIGGVGFSNPNTGHEMRLSTESQVDKGSSLISPLKNQPSAAMPDRRASYPPGTTAKTPTRKKIRLILIILIAALLLLIILAFIYILFFIQLPSERELNSGENIKKAVVLKSGEALVRLGEEINLESLLEVQIIFSINSVEYIYKPGYISREYQVRASDAGLGGFDDVTSVRAVFLYKSEEQNDTLVYPLPVNQSSNQTNLTTGRNFTGGGGGDDGSECVPNCAGKNCGDNGCGGTCGSCSLGYSCISGKCIVPSKLISYWEFEGSANDTLGINNGSVYGATLARGISGKAYNFDGVDDYINISDSSSLHTTAFTIAALVKVSENKTMGIFSDDMTGLNTQWELFIKPGSNGGKGALWYSPDKISLASNTSLNKNRWHHLLATYNGSDISLYVDGILENSSYVVNSTNYSKSSPGIGMINLNWPPGNPFNGTIDEVKIWNYALSKEEIKKEYENCTNKLVAYWKFDGDTNDSVGGSNGIIHGNPILTQGVSSQAYNFDGVDDYIEIPSAGIDLEYGFSISSWAYLQEQVADYPGIFWKDDTIVLRYCPAEFSIFNNFQGFVRIGTFLEPRVQSGPYSDKNRWYHLVMTYNSSESENNLKLYINGSLVSTTTRTGHVDFSKGNFYVGRYYPAPTHYFNGTIDEVKIWNYALSTEEISGIYESQKPTTQVVPAIGPFVGFWESINKFFHNLF